MDSRGFMWAAWRSSLLLTGLETHRAAIRNSCVAQAGRRGRCVSGGDLGDTYAEVESGWGAHTHTFHSWCGFAEAIIREEQGRTDSSRRRRGSGDQLQARCLRGGDVRRTDSDRGTGPRVHSLNTTAQKAKIAHRVNIDLFCEVCHF